LLGRPEIYFTLTRKHFYPYTSIRQEARCHKNRKIAFVRKNENRLKKEKDMNFLLQPKKYKSLMADKGSKAIMDKTIAFFEKMGKTRLLDDYNKKVWYREFVDFIGKEQIFSKLLTPKQYAGGDPDARWDTARNSEYSELLAFFLWPGLLVLFPSDHPEIRPYLDEPK